ncbi:hypothetical protein [Legionella tunisiensis]|uniref:hypothetical protein n=1 Tax=Legionella tunisiensis TaxID=1034944 RepID=UPI000313F213|nr:hypothetical protein [Legionella tunisiensis]
MFTWFQRYNTHKTEANKENQEFDRMYKDERESDKEFRENNKELFTQEVEDTCGEAKNTSMVLL